MTLANAERLVPLSEFRPVDALLVSMYLTTWAANSQTHRHWEIVISIFGCGEFYRLQHGAVLNRIPVSPENGPPSYCGRGITRLCRTSTEPIETRHHPSHRGGVIVRREAGGGEERSDGTLSVTVPPLDLIRRAMNSLVLALSVTDSTMRNWIPRKSRINPIRK